MRNIEEKTFLLLVAAASLAFLVLLWQLYGAILWGTVLAILFYPVYRGLQARLGSNVSAAATILIIVVIVILPLAVIATALVYEAGGLYDWLQSERSHVDGSIAGPLEQVPGWLRGLLERLGMENLAEVQKKIASVIQESGQYLAQQVLSIGQSTVQLAINLFVMIYLLFFLLRDGRNLFERITQAIPVRSEQQRMLFEKFATVIRATIKGDIVVSVLQGLLGGLIFWVLDIRAPALWAVVMALCSLLPTIGSALVWFPVALYLLATGWIWQGIMLIAFGAFVIGLVDNFLRPMLVGKDAKLPDYVVLISTLAGLQLFGINGFVLGPMIAATFIAVWEMFAKSRMEA